MEVLFGEWYHFIGIGGAGMSGLARILIKSGIKVSGSDLVASSNFNRLKEEGALVKVGHAAANLAPGVDQVVVSSAIPASNPEILAAKAAGIPVISRGELLAQIMARYKGIAVVGAHGKTTTSSMVSLVLEHNGFDPTIIIGGEVNDIGGNAKLGRGKYLVAEADESDGSFLKLSPYGAVITNIDNDHLDYYKNIGMIISAFQHFLEKIRPDGFAVLCTDNDLVGGLETGSLERISYGLKGHPLYQAVEVVCNGFTTTADILYQGEELGRLTLHVPGIHNVLNALAAIAVGRKLGLDFERIAAALATFRGVQRRFQLIAQFDGLRIVDDYAHHPTEIAALMRTSTTIGAKRRIVVFQPHRYTRTKNLYHEFGQVLQGPDQVIVSDIYSAGETPIPGVSSRLIVEAIAAGGQKVTFIPQLDDIVSYLRQEVQDGDLVLTVGAGNVCTVGKRLAGLLRQESAVEETRTQTV